MTKALPCFLATICLATLLAAAPAQAERRVTDQAGREVILPDREVGIAQWWSGILGLGEQKLPIARELAPGLVVAVRLGGMGVAIGSLVGQEAADLIAP